MQILRKSLVAGLFCAMVAASQAFSLDSEDVVRMLASGVGENAVMNVVASQGLSRPVTTHDLNRLRSVGASESLISFMMSPGYNQGYNPGYNPGYIAAPQPVVVAPPPVIYQSPPVVYSYRPPVAYYAPPRPRPTYSFSFSYGGGRSYGGSRGYSGGYRGGPGSGGRRR